MVDAVGEFLEHLGDRDPLADEVADALATVQPIAVGARLAPSGCAAAAVPAALVGLDLRLESGDLGLGGRELLLERAVRGNLRLERRLRSRPGLVGAVRVVLVEDALHRERGRLEAVRLARLRGELALHADLHAHVCAERGPLGADRVEDVFLDHLVGEVPLGALEQLVRLLDARLELGEARGREVLESVGGVRLLEVRAQRLRAHVLGVRVLRLDERLDRRDALLDVVVVVGVLVRQHLGQRVVVLDGVLQRTVELARQSLRQVPEVRVDLGRDVVRLAGRLVAHAHRQRLGLALRARPDGALVDDVEEVPVLLRRGPHVAEPLVELPLGALVVGRNHQLVRRRHVVVMSRGSLPRRYQL